MSNGKITYILGAGFSKALHSSMPITDELGNSVIQGLRDSNQISDESYIPKAFDNSLNFEQWFSWLAIRQPYEDSAMWSKKQELFFKVRKAIWAQIYNSQKTYTPNEDYKVFFEDIRDSKANILTFNYDTIFEDSYNSNAVEGDEVFDLTPYITDNPGLSINPNELTSEPFLYKLHGSVNWLKIPDDRLGVSLVEKDVKFFEQWSNSKHLNFTNGYEEYIIPLLSTKGMYYDNPFIQSLWNDSYNALKDSDEIVIIGYSFPTTDYAVVNMFIESIKESIKGGKSSRDITIVGRPINNKSSDEAKKEVHEVKGRIINSLGKYAIVEKSEKNDDGRFTISTIDGMEEYIKTLEDNINTNNKENDND
ncbi:hypothetical protein FACS1894125_6650 [Actinomycetota bacterium]|nr:hypothetical protein FACS1894125_6650 [Actinomycetota bacterium]